MKPKKHMKNILRTHKAKKKQWFVIRQKDKNPFKQKTHPKNLAKYVYMFYDEIKQIHHAEPLLPQTKTF